MPSAQTSSATRIWLYAIWLFLANFQAKYMTLLDDEAYYRYYALHLSWGYFDHPPMVALLARLGILCFGDYSELALRSFFILLNLSTLLLIEKLVKPAQFMLFFLTLSGSVFLHMGFLALPDAPLLFFGAAYFLVLKKYIEKDSPINALGLALIIAGMLLSKYHGILLVFFTLAAMPALLRRPTLYLILTLVCLLMLPHTLWQYEHNWVSLRYHLTGRSLNAYRAEYTLSYVAIVLFALFGLQTFLLLYAAITHKPQHAFTRILKFNALGILLFFFLMSFKGAVEANWISLALIPLLALVYPRLALLDSRLLQRYKRLSWATLIILLFLRLMVLTNLTGIQLMRYNTSEAFSYKVIRNKAGNLPVVFMNSYQDAAKYAFYEHSAAYSLSNVLGRQSEYTLQTEASLRGKTVFVLLNFPHPAFDSVYFHGDMLNYKVVENFQSYSSLRFEPIHAPQTWPAHTQQTLLCRLTENQLDPCHLQANPEFPAYVSYQFFKDNVMVKNVRTQLLLTDSLKGTTFAVTVETPEAPGSYVLELGITAGWLPACTNSGDIKVKIK